MHSTSMSMSGGQIRSMVRRPAEVSSAMVLRRSLGWGDLLASPAACGWSSTLVMVCGVASPGRCNAQGSPPFLQIAPSARSWDMYLAGPPVAWQRALVAALGPLARLRGYRASYHRFSAGYRATRSRSACALLTPRTPITTTQRTGTHRRLAPNGPDCAFSSTLPHHAT